MTAAVIAAGGGQLRTLALAVTVVVTLVVYWLAEEYAELLGEHTRAGQLPSVNVVRSSLAAAWPMVTASFVPLAASSGGSTVRSILSRRGLDRAKYCGCLARGSRLRRGQSGRPGRYSLDSSHRDRGIARGGDGRTQGSFAAPPQLTGGLVKVPLCHGRATGRPAAVSTRLPTVEPVSGTAIAAGADPRACLGFRTRRAPGRDSNTSGGSMSSASPSMPISTGADDSTLKRGVSHSSHPRKLRTRPAASRAVKVTASAGLAIRAATTPRVPRSIRLRVPRPARWSSS